MVRYNIDRVLTLQGKKKKRLVHRRIFDNSGPFNLLWANAFCPLSRSLIIFTLPFKRLRSVEFLRIKKENDTFIQQG